MQKLKYYIWNILMWLDNNINHTIVDKLFDLFPDVEDGKPDFFYWLWRHTARAYCNFVSIVLVDRDWDIKPK